jgi:hypothetical protein
MPVTPRRMAQRKAEFRAGQANYNRLVQLYGNLKRRFAEVNRLEMEHYQMTGNINRAVRETVQNYGNTPQGRAQTHRMMLMWHARERKLRQKQNAKAVEVVQAIRNMRPIIREYYRLRYGLNNATETNENLWNNTKNNIESRRFSPKRMARLKLARLINKAAVRPGGWVYKRLFKGLENNLRARA